jgi:sigma-B regulation protein RsbU (phosphoserine phosphatase)
MSPESERSIVAPLVLRRGAEITIFSPLLSPARHSLAVPLVTIGRAAECTIPIKDRYLSRKHAEIVSSEAGWVLKDCGSANGTFLNGSRVERDSPLRSGDRIRLGDTEIVFQIDHVTDRMLSVADSKVSATISIPVDEIVDKTPELSGKSLERLRILNALAMELIEDRPFDQLSGFIVDRVMEHLKPSRAAVGLLGKDGKTFLSVEVRRQDAEDQSELTISHTLLSEVVEEKKALAFMDVTVDEKLSRAQSIIMQGIHSVLCAPLTIGNSVVGLLYVDFLYNQRSISEDDVRLVAQIARFAAIKLENGRLRDEAIEKRLMDEELKTAYSIQRRLLPESPPMVPGYTFFGLNRPCRTVSGDYYDFLVRPDGRVYFVIADVSGKGVTAALPMAGLQTAFRIYAQNDPAPGELIRQLNVTLKGSLPQSKFITLFAARLEPETGRVEFANAGHSPPIWIRASGAEELSETDLLLGMFTNAEYKNQVLHLDAGDSLLLYTDGVSEAENRRGEELGSVRLASLVAPLHGLPAAAVADSVEQAVVEHIGSSDQNDDLTMVVVSRDSH